MLVRDPWGDLFPVIHVTATDSIRVDADWMLIFCWLYSHAALKSNAVFSYWLALHDDPRSTSSRTAKTHLAWLLIGTLIEFWEPKFRTVALVARNFAFFRKHNTFHYHSQLCFRDISCWLRSRTHKHHHISHRGAIQATAVTMLLIFVVVFVALP